MKWLATRVREAGRTDLPDDPWWYKDEYNRRLMQTVSARVEAVLSGAQPQEDYRIAGAAAFLQALQERGVRCYVASGTDDKDVRNEGARLGVDRFFAASPARRSTPRAAPRKRRCACWWKRSA